MYRVLLLLIPCLFILACQPTQTESESLTDSDLEAREDSLELVAAYAAQEKIELSVYPAIETTPVQASFMDDAVDDPAIWIHPEDVSRSLIFGSNKKGGLAAYNLEGEEVAYYPIGNINNVDILNEFTIGDRTIYLLGCSNRSDQSINLFSIHPEDGKLTNIAEGELLVDPQKIDDIYGFCFARLLESDKAYAVINGKNGLLQQFELKPGEFGIQLDLSREVQFDSQTEGMVADNELGFLYVGEENRGIWKLNIDPATGNKKQFIKNSGAENPNIRYDVEGLTLYKSGEAGYLIASSQGNFSYAIFERSGDNSYLMSFKIRPTDVIDGVEETDGLDVTPDSLSPVFPRGLIVMQDGFNYDGDTLRAQNLKLVSWGEVEKLLGE